MPDEINLVKISDLPAATSPGEYDVLPGVQAGDTKQFSFGMLFQWIKNILRPADIGAVPVERTVNNKSLIQNITLTASDVGAVDTDDVGIAGGVASLDGDGRVPSSQLPPISSDAADISYDNTGSGLTADDVQEAIDELAAGAVSVDLSTIAPVEDSTTATQAHPLGSIFYYNDLLYRALVDIPVGGTINTAAGGNATETTVAANFKRTVTLTAAEYAQLSAAEKAADIVYIITDDNAIAASNVTYDPTTSGMSAATVQEAVDELAVAVEARYTATVIFNTLTNVSSDTTITMDEDFTAYKFLMIVLNTRSPASASYRIPLVVSTNALPQGGFYPVINPDGSGYVRLNYVSGQTKQVRFQATDMSALYVASISGLR